MSSKRAHMLIPAFNTKPSICPKESIALFTISLHSSRIVISVLLGMDLPPELLIIEQTLSSSSNLLAAQTIKEPEEDSCLQSSSPIPDDAPVTIKTLSFKFTVLNPAGLLV